MTRLEPDLEYDALRRLARRLVAESRGFEIYRDSWLVVPAFPRSCAEDRSESVGGTESW